MPASFPPLPFSLPAAALALFLILACSAGTAAADPAPGPDPSRIVLTPTAHPETSQTVTWRTDAATTGGEAEIRPATGGATVTVAATGKAPVDLPGWTYSSRHHTATFTGLKPQTVYEFRVGGSQGRSEWFRFRTAGKGTAAPLTLLSFGDVQTSLDTVWPQTVELALAKAPSAAASIYAGDLVDQGSDDVQWDDWFTGLGSSATAINQIPAVGNHEIQGDTALLQFGSHFTPPGNGPDTDFTRHTYDLKSTVGFTDLQGVRIITLDGNDVFPGDQVDFLERALKTNPGRWSVVVVHQPFISNEPGGASPFIGRAPFMPVLKRYRPDLVLQGHNHSYARGWLDMFDRSDGTHGGPVFLSSVSGPKRTDVSTGPPDDWSANRATRARSFRYTATVQRLDFSSDRIRVRSYIAIKQPDSDAAGEVGDLADAFTIIRRRDGGNTIREGIVNPKPAPARIRLLRVTRLHGGTTARAKLRVPVPATLRVTGRGLGGRARLRTVRRKFAKPATVTVPLRFGRVTAKVPYGTRVRLKLKFTCKPANGGVQRLRRNLTLTWR